MNRNQFEYENILKKKTLIFLKKELSDEISIKDESNKMGSNKIELFIVLMKIQFEIDSKGFRRLKPLLTP